MSYFITLKRSLADKLFSNFIRQRDDWTCQKCKIPYHDNRAYLDCSHFFSRAKRSVRFDPTNALAMCKRCHDYLGRPENLKEHQDIFIKHWGELAIDLLHARALTPQRVDERLIVIGLKAELARLKSERKVLTDFK